MANRSELIANIAVTCMALATVAMLGYSFMRSDTAPASRRNPYKTGQVFDLPMDHALSTGERSLVMIVQSRCEYCTASMPFYRALVEERARSGRRVNIVAVSLDPLEIGRAYLKEHGVEVDAVVPYKGTTPLRFNGTPTLVAIDPARRVLAVWEGRLPADAESKVRETLFSR